MGGSPVECVVVSPTRLLIFIPTPAPTLSEWPSQEQRGSGLTASAPVSDVSIPACTNGVWLPLRPVSVAQKNKPSTMLSSNVQSIDLLMECMAWRFWKMRQSNGCSTLAPRSRAAKQWFDELVKKKKNPPMIRKKTHRDLIFFQNIATAYNDRVKTLVSLVVS